MTYCLSMRLDEGLVLISDTRTNAGVDNVSTYGKLHVFRPGPDRTFAIQSAGNLATTQEVLDRIGRDLTTGGPESLATVSHLFEAALYVGRLSQEVAAAHRPALSAVGADGTATFLLSGQVGDEPPDTLLVYPEGNYIRASDDRPFLQIGEAKYGKFLLDIAVRFHVGLESAVKIGLGSMVATARANLSVGPPYDVGVYVSATREFRQRRLGADSSVLAELDQLWQSHLSEIVNELPAVDLNEPD